MSRSARESNPRLVTRSSRFSPACGSRGLIFASFGAFENVIHCHIVEYFRGGTNEEHLIHDGTLNKAKFQKLA